MDLQFPALDKSLKPLFTLHKVKIANLDSGTLEKKENWFSIFVIKVSSQIIHQELFAQLCAKAERGASQNYKMLQTHPPRSFQTCMRAGGGWVGADFFFSYHLREDTKRVLIWNSSGPSEGEGNSWQ